MARVFACPLCTNEEAAYPSRESTICDSCGAAIEEMAARLLLVAKSSFRTFCSPDCLKKYQTLDKLYTRAGSTRKK